MMRRETYRIALAGGYFETRQGYPVSEHCYAEKRDGVWVLTLWPSGHYLAACRTRQDAAEIAQRVEALKPTFKRDGTITRAARVRIRAALPPLRPVG